MASDEQYMDEALALAGRGCGFVSPNPMVGALVVKDDVVLGRGWHKDYGGPHAEVFALQEAGERARGATLYCTLEPCNHTGKTPPCSQAVIRAGISRVVLGALDTNPVAGGGVSTLRSAGIEVLTGIREHECRLINAAFFKHIKTGLPLVSLKWAMSADGKTATRTGDSKWITCAESREAGHRLRAAHDAVLVGINTLVADGARLTCRLPAGSDPVRQPRRIILDSQARTPRDAPLWNEPGGGPIIIMTGETAPAERRKSLEAAGAEVIALGGTRPKISDVLNHLGARRIQSVLVEGGSNVLGSFIDSRLVDQIYVFVAPRIIGGAAALPAVGGEGIDKLTTALDCDSLRAEPSGKDVRLHARCGEWKW